MKYCCAKRLFKGYIDTVCGLIQLKTSMVASHPFNLAETYSPIGSHFDKSDNLHFNGDYHKMLACSHFCVN